MRADLIFAPLVGTTHRHAELTNGTTHKCSTHASRQKHSRCRWTKGRHKLRTPLICCQHYTRYFFSCTFFQLNLSRKVVSWIAQERVFRPAPQTVLISSTPLFDRELLLTDALVLLLTSPMVDQP